MTEEQKIIQKIIDLKTILSSPNSDIGDWKIAKCMEYQSMGLELPYDITDLGQKRQLIRDEINELQSNLDSLENTERM